MKRIIAASILALAAATALQAQQIEEQFNKYAAVQPAEKLFVHTDKEFYLAGEIIWFKIYQETGPSQVAYLDLVDANNKSALAARISLEPGKNNGSLLVPLSLNSGTYRLRAYTTWMRNNPEESFFEKNVSIVNPFRNPDSSAVTTPGPGMQFFPEGGNMVKGLGSNVAFRITDRYGRGVHATGVVLNASNDTVARFAPLKFGLGSFSFTPAEKHYRAVVTLGTGEVLQSTLPGIQDEGYVMTVSSTSNASNVSVKTNYTGPQQVTVVVRHGHSLIHNERITLDRGNGAVQISHDKLRPGINQVTVFNGLNQPVCERLVFLRPATTPLLAASTAKPVFGNREKVQIGLQLKQAKTNSADLSVSVFPADFQPAEGGMDINAYHWLFSELKGDVESPAYYFSNDPDVEQATEHLLLTHGWRRFSWKQVLASRPAVPVFAAETSGHTITAKITHKQQHTPLADQEVLLSVSGQRAAFATGYTDQQGLVRFRVKDLFGVKKILLQLNRADASAYNIEIVSPFHPANGNVAAGKGLIPADAALLEKYSINMQVQNIYHADSMRIFYASEPKDTTPFYGRALYSYQLDAYTRFKTMEEVLREYVQEIAVGASNGRLYLKIADEGRKVFNEDNLLVLWDGVPLQDPHSIFSFDPLKVKKLEIIPRRFAAGGSIFNGLAAFTTYSGDLSGYRFAADNSIDYEGLQLQREFYSPAYQDQASLKSRMPDFRNTLFWAPNVRTNDKGEATLEFYTGDRKGKYIAVIQGLDDSGQPVSTKMEFEVK